MTNDAATARGFLMRQRVARLATVDESGAPHVVPVCFALVEQTVYIAIDEKPKRVGREVRRLQRLRNIAAEPRVALVADVYDDADWGRLGWVMARGTARVLEEGQEHAAALAALRGKYAQYAAMALEGRPVIALAIERLTAWGELDT
ncbi:MAG TPA: TIGR03668 family PPOX class F420-dependent oxidoreductase [Chloroflexota bacterium]|jgi:PPOX class probable F420-dependent enzyme